MRRKKTGLAGPLRALLSAVIAGAVVLAFLTALSNLDRGQEAEGRQQLEEAIRRTCVACYAAEGVYPPDLDYLRTHYGLQLDEERYAVFYDVFASNLMPDITVVEREA